MIRAFPVRPGPFLAALVAIAALIGAAVSLARIDADLIGYLPPDDPVIADAVAFFRGHPIQDQLAVDLESPTGDRKALLAAADEVEARLKSSGLFDRVGVGSMGAAVAGLAVELPERLPVLFSADDLADGVAPRLTPERVRDRLENLRRDLSSLSGIGRGRTIAGDPLGLSEIVLARLAHQRPTDEVRMVRGRMLSADGTHLLLVAHPKKPGTDTAFARKLSGLMAGIEADLADDADLRMTPMGAFRAALDNETIARRDVKTAVTLAGIGITLLLILAFPRPLVGLLAFFPALAGTAAAWFAMSVIYDAVSLMVLGFGGAIISITVDHGIAYLLFLDRPEETAGKQAAREVRAVGLLAALTTVGAFGALFLSDFPILEQLGLFTAMGIGFSFLFVHTVFPAIFPRLPAAAPRRLPVQGIADRLTAPRHGPAGALLCAALAVLLVGFARPDFTVDLSAMNTVSPEAAADERRMTEIWGGRMLSRVYVMTGGDSVAGLRETWDRTLIRFREDRAREVFTDGFVPAAIYPGETVRQANYAAWRDFWTPDRIDEVRKTLTDAGADLGFSPGAFSPFFRTLAAPLPPAGPVPERDYPLLGIAEAPGGSGWVSVSGMTPGPAYDPAAFRRDYAGEGSHCFDPGHFGDHLGGLLFSTFFRMLLVVGACVTGLLFVFFLDWRYTLTALLPVGFALVCTLGTLRLVGHPLDIPGLMLGIVVFGMGVDYALFLVRSHQRYGDIGHPAAGPVKTAVFMAAASTLIGFGALVFADHALLHGAGVTSATGIAFSAAGAFFILPPVLRSRFIRRPRVSAGGSVRDRVLARYRGLEPYPRLFARFKTALDPMFAELSDRVGSPVRVIDLGCGFGVPGAWILETSPAATVFGIDPDPERVRVAGAVFGDRGRAAVGAAPDLSSPPDEADLALMLDMAHYLDDPALEATLAGLRQRLTPGGRLLIRAVIPPAGRGSRLWRLDALRRRIARIPATFRTQEEIAAALDATGFDLKGTSPSGGNPESVWFDARVRA
jgi:uncharacterized protein